MLFSDDCLHFLKIKIFFCWIDQNYIVALRGCAYIYIYLPFMCFKQENLFKEWKYVIDMENDNCLQVELV